jgi:hypothetical protein
MNVNIFIIRVLKLLFMSRFQILVILCALCIFAAPASASLLKIRSGAPIFIGERNLDISSSLDGHTVIGWWAPGSDLNGPPDKTISLSDDDIRNFYVNPDIFTGRTGKWYSYDKAPNIYVFEVMEPQIDLKVWDLDNDRDVTGQSIPSSTNITYRIDTNLYLARNYASRSDYTASESFVTVTLTNPNGISVPQIFTGNVGDKKTQILFVENNPIMTSPTYYWRDGGSWDRNARSADGSIIYPTGTYTFTLTQNLNSMQNSFNMSDPTAGIGKVRSGAKTITFLAVPQTESPTAVPSLTTTTQTVVTTVPATVVTTVSTTAVPTSTKTTVKPTYTPLPVWVVIAGIGLAAVVAMGRRHD